MKKKKKKESGDEAEVFQCPFNTQSGKMHYDGCYICQCHSSRSSSSSSFSPHVHERMQVWADPTPLSCKFSLFWGYISQFPPPLILTLGLLFLQIPDPALMWAKLLLLFILFVCLFVFLLFLFCFVLFCFVFWGDLLLLWLLLLLFFFLFLFLFLLLFCFLFFVFLFFVLFCFLFVCLFFFCSYNESFFFLSFFLKKKKKKKTTFQPTPGSLTVLP